MVREDGKRTRAEIFGDSILPGLGSQEGWHMDQEKRQTKALEKIAKGYKDRRIVQEVARRESSVPDKRVYDLPSAYVPDEVVRGFSNIVDAQHGTTGAVQENTSAVRQSAEVIYGGLMSVESRVGDVVDAAYSIDRHVQEGNDLTRETNQKLDVVNENLETIDETIYVQTEKLNDSVNGISPDRKGLNEIASITGLDDVEMISMALKGVLDRDTSEKYFSSFSARKKGLILHVADYKPDFHQPLEQEIARFKKARWDTTDRGQKDVFSTRITKLENQISQEKKFIRDLSAAMKAPLRVDSLRVLARHGKLDRFVQDEAGESIREVRTDVYGLNQSMREMLVFMEDHWGNANEIVENQEKQISLQEREIEIGEIQVQQQQVQIELQTFMLEQLGFIGNAIEQGFANMSAELQGIHKTLELVAWTNVRVLETLEGIKIDITDQTQNWLSHRFEERLRQIVPMFLMGKYKPTISALDKAQEEDVSDPRSYFLKGISYMYTKDLEKAETELCEANDYAEGLSFRGAPQKEVDKIISQVNTYLARLYFKLSQKEENKNQEEYEEKAIICAGKAYEKGQSVVTSMDLARYFSVAGRLDEAYLVIREAFQKFPEIVDILLTDEDFAPFVEQVKRNKWKELHDLRVRMLNRLNK